LNPKPSHPHSKALTIKPSPHVMTKNDVAKYINTYFEQKMILKISLFDFIDLVGLNFKNMCKS
jgi:hypothetical protein